MIQPRLVWELARKDLAVFASDRRGMLLCFAVPILLASAFGAIFYQPAEDGPGLRPRVHLVVEDASSICQRIEKQLLASPDLLVTSCDRESARRRLISESSGVVLLLPVGFGKALRRNPSGSVGPGVEGRLELWHHPSSAIEARCVEGIFTEIALREAARDLLAPLGLDVAQMQRPFQVQRESIPSGGALASHAFSHSFCGMTLQYLLFWGMDSGLMLLRERRSGLWRRLRAAPLSRGTLLAGKALATALIALAQIVVTFSFGALFFGVTINGSWLGFLLVALAAALLASATGLLVAALGGNETRARSISILVILSLSLLGGLWLPAFLLPGWARTFALALPTTWAARGLEGVVWQGMEWSQAAHCAGILALFGLGFLVFAWWRLVRADSPCVVAQGD